MADYQARIDVLVGNLNQLEQLERRLNSATASVERLQDGLSGINTAAGGAARRVTDADVELGQAVRSVRNTAQRRTSSGRFTQGPGPDARRLAAARLRAARAELAEADQSLRLVQRARRAQQGALIDAQASLRSIADTRQQQARVARNDLNDAIANSRAERARTRINRTLDTVARVRPNTARASGGANLTTAQRGELAIADGRIAEARRLAGAINPRIRRGIATGDEVRALEKYATELESLGENFREIDRLIKLRSDTFENNRRAFERVEAAFRPNAAYPQGRQFEGSPQQERIRSLATAASDAANAGQSELAKRLNTTLTRYVSRIEKATGTEIEVARTNDRLIRARERAASAEIREGRRIGKLNASPVGGYKTLAASPKGMAEAAKQFRSQVTENEKASASAVALNKQREKALRDEVKANEAQSASAVSLNKQREKAQRDMVKLNEQMSASAVSLNKQRQQAFKDEVRGNEKASASAVAREKQRQKALADKDKEALRIAKDNASPVRGGVTIKGSPLQQQAARKVEVDAFNVNTSWGKALESMKMTAKGLRLRNLEARNSWQRFFEDAKEGPFAKVRTRATKGSAVPVDSRAIAEAELLRLEKELSKKLSILKRAQTQAKSGQIGPQDFEAINNEAKLLSKAYSDRKNRLAVAAKETGILITQDFIDGITKGAQQAAQSNREQDLFLKASALQPAIKAPAAAAKGTAVPFTAEDAFTKAETGRQRALGIQQTLSGLAKQGVAVAGQEARLQKLITGLNEAEAKADEKSLNAVLKKLSAEQQLAAILAKNSKEKEAKAKQVSDRDSPFSFDPMERARGMMANFKGKDFESLALGAGFPLLFGGGAGSILGSVFGSLIGPSGGFGGQILGGAVGQQFESMIVSVKNLQDAFDGLTGDFSKLREQGIAASAEAEKQYRDLKGQGKFDEANKLARNQAAFTTGDINGNITEAASGSAKRLQAAWDGVYKAISTTVALLAGPFLDILGVVLRIVQAVTASFNAIVSSVMALVRAIPGAESLLKAMQGLAAKMSPAYEQTLADMDKMISSQKKLNELAAQNADRAVAGAGLEGPDKTRYELVTRELERQKKLEDEIASIRKDNPADTKEQRDRIKQLEEQARLASQIESNQDRGITAKQLVREQIQFERQKADAVREAYREQFQLARRAYDLEIAVIDLRRQEADYERAVVDFRLKAENQIAESRNAAAESDLEVARARLELAKTETATRFDQKIYASGGGVEGDALENEKQIQLLKLEGAVQENELRIRTEIAIDKLKRDQIQLQRQWEQEVINLERQRDAVLRAQVQLQRQLEDYKMASSDYQLKIARLIADEFINAAMQMQAALAGGMGGGLTGGAGAVFGDTGIDKGTGYNAAGWVHGHLQNMDPAALKADAMDMTKQLLDAGVKVVIQGIELSKGATQKQIEDAVNKGIAGHKAYGSGARAIDISVPVGTMVPTQVRNIRDSKGRGGIIGDIGSRGTQLMHLAQGSVTGAGGMAGGSNLAYGYVRRLMNLETDDNPRTNPGSARDPVRGALQFKTSTALDAQRRLQIPASSLQSNSFDVAAPAAIQYLQKQHPQAYAAIQAGNYDLADSLLKRTWTSLPGGAEARPADVQARARQFLGTTQTGASLQGIPRPPLPPKPTLATPSAVPGVSDVTAAGQASTDKRVQNATLLEQIAKQQRDANMAALEQQRQQVLEGPRILQQKRDELELLQAGNAVVGIRSKFEADLAVLRSQADIKLKQNDELQQRILASTERTGEQRVKDLEALQRRTENLKEELRLEELKLKVLQQQELAREANGVANDLRNFGAGMRAGYRPGSQAAGTYEQYLSTTGDKGTARAFADAQAVMDELQQAMSDAQNIGGTIAGGIKEGLKAAVTGGDVAAAFSSMFASLGDIFLERAFRPIEDMLTKAVFGLIGPEEKQLQAAILMQQNAVGFMNAAMVFQAAVAQMTAAQAVGGFGGGGAGFAKQGFGLAQSLIPSLFSGGGGGLAAGLGGVSNNVGLAFSPGISFLASGGRARAGTPYVVGEEGPELFIPGVSGQVIPSEESVGIIQDALDGEDGEDGYDPIGSARAAMRGSLSSLAGGEGGAGGMGGAGGPGGSGHVAYMAAAREAMLKSMNGMSNSEIYNEMMSERSGSNEPIKVETIRAGDMNLVTEDQLRTGMAQAQQRGAKQGEAAVLRRMKNSVSLPGVR